MASHFQCFLPILLLLFLLHLPTTPSSAAVVEQPPLVLSYHHGPLLKGNYTLNVLWYGSFTPSQRSIILDFLLSLNPSTHPPPHSVSAWWSATEAYTSPSTSGPTAFALGKQITIPALRNTLKSSDLAALARKASDNDPRAISIILTSTGVAIDGFCSSRCGTHGSLEKGRHAYVWVGNPAAQCPGRCAWPFHQPIHGPQTPPLVAPNGDVGVDGMVVNLGSLLTGAVTNPYGDGFYQGEQGAGLEAASACTGVFGKGAYPGYPGEVMVDSGTGGSYNANGCNGRKYLLPALWDPRTSRCATPV